MQWTKTILFNLLNKLCVKYQFSTVQSLSHVQLLVTPWTTREASGVPFLRKDVAWLSCPNSAGTLRSVFHSWICTLWVARKGQLLPVLHGVNRGASEAGGHLKARGWNPLKAHSHAWRWLLAVSWELSQALGFPTAGQLGSENKHPKRARRKCGVFRT